MDERSIIIKNSNKDYWVLVWDSFDYLKKAGKKFGDSAVSVKINCDKKDFFLVR